MHAGPSGKGDRSPAQGIVTAATDFYLPFPAKRLRFLPFALLCVSRQSAFLPQFPADQVFDMQREL
jgi:hypothetical protein